jgi:hypothetical protein
MGHLKSTVGALLPSGVRAAYRRYQQARRAHLESDIGAEEVFTRIYARNGWGGPPGSFNSGSGSHEPAIVAPYVATVTAELRRLGAAKMTVVDLGCGDFSIGGELAPACGRYLGVDIVRPLIDHNRATFGTDRVAFRHLNIVDDELPEGHVCVVRQVFQHLSNREILAVLPKLARYRWCFVTEHHPSPDRLRCPNLDKAHGSDIRLYQGSGVFLESAPFDIPLERYRLILEVPGCMPEGVDPGIIRTFLLEHPATAPERPKAG